MKPRMLAVKPSELVILAIHNLEEKEGSYPQDIVKFISTQYGIESEHVKKHVEEALQRGTQFGILAENQGRYMLEEVPQPPQENENESIPNQETAENQSTSDNVRKRRSSRKRSLSKRKSSDLFDTESLELLEKRQKSNAGKTRKNNKRKTKGNQGEGSKTRRRSARQR